MQLSDAHQREINQMQRDCDNKLGQCNLEMQALRSQLQEAGLSPKRPDDEERKADGAELGNGESSAIVLEGSVDNVFEIKPAWEESMEGAAWGDSLDSFLARCGTSGETKSEPSGGAAATAQKRSRFVIMPNSVFRVNWDFVGLFLICYDLITIPFNQAFQPEPGWFSLTMDWITLLFWTADMFQGFVLGYFAKGQLITRHGSILKHYLTTWFVADIVVVGPEWLMMFVSGDSDSGGAAGAGTLLKSARAVRVLRLLRLAKVQRMLNLLYDLIESEYTFILINLMKLLISVLVLNHVVACGWYQMGKMAMDNDMNSWIQTSGVIGEATTYVYSTSLHWSLTQFTPASMDVSAKNIFERVFSIVVLFFAMVVFSSIVGSISGSMTTLRSMKSDQMKQFWLLRRYLRQRSVSKDLSSRIYKYLEHQCGKQNNHVQPCQLKVLDGLSESLQNELTHQMHSPHLLEHPFFRYLNEEMEVVMHRLCRIALKPQSYAEREFVFGAGDEAKKMFFVKSGKLDYTTMDRTSLNPPPRVREWISEALLWTSWRHQGDLLAMIESELISLDPGQFVEVMNVHPRPWFYAKQYAFRFIKLLNRLGKAAVTDILRHEQFYEQAVDSIEAGQNSAPDESAYGLREVAHCENDDATPEGSSNEVFPEDDGFSGKPLRANSQSRLPPQLVRRRIFGLCPCPASFTSVVPGPNVATMWQ